LAESPIPLSANEEADVMSQEQCTLPDGSKWEAERLRATIFILPGAEVAGMESWWKQVVEDEPEEVLTRPREGQLQHTGVFEGKRLALVVQPGRVDWTLLAPLESPDELAERFPTMGQFSGALEPFLRVARRWLDVCPAVTRLAFGAILIRSVADRQSGYSEISPLLPDVRIDSENSSDFFYQINRPRISKSGMGGLKVNRLTKWSVTQAGLIQIAIGAGAGTVLHSGPRQFACRLELDMSTAAEFSGEIPKDKTPSVFEELVRLGREIANRGDIP
jgi:hypothetical protein